MPTGVSVVVSVVLTEVSVVSIGVSVVVSVVPTKRFPLYIRKKRVLSVLQAAERDDIDAVGAAVGIGTHCCQYHKE